MKLYALFCLIWFACAAWVVGTEETYADRAAAAIIFLAMFAGINWVIFS